MVDKRQKSSFIREIEKDNKIIESTADTRIPCPKCQEGNLVIRDGVIYQGRKLPDFYGCSNFPYCDFQKKQEDNVKLKEYSDNICISDEHRKNYRYKVWPRYGNAHISTFIDFRVEADVKQVDVEVINNNIKWICYESEKVIDRAIFIKYGFEYELIK